MKFFGCHGNELPIKEILYQSVFGDKYYMIGHKFMISVTMDVSPFAWCLARAVLNTYGRGAHLGYMNSIMSSNFIPLYLKALMKNLVQNGTVVSEKIRFKFSYVHDLGPRSRNVLDLQYSHTFINLIRCLLLPIFWTLAAIVSENPLLSFFLLEKPHVQKLTLPLNRSRSTQGHHLNNI